MAELPINEFPVFENFAESVCNGLSFISLIMVGLTVLWFAFLNFVANEVYHPLDFYSNTLRTKPYWYMIEVVLLGGIVAGVASTGQLGTFHKFLPELASAIYLQGLAITLVVALSLSAGAAMTAQLAYAFTAACLTLIVTIPTAPGKRPGVVYSGLYFLINIIWVAWLRVGMRRHYGRDNKQVNYPPGFEKLPQLWASAVLWGNPLLLFITNLVYLVVYMIDLGMYGGAFAAAYFVVSTVLVLGCCRSYRAGTELEE